MFHFAQYRSLSCTFVSFRYQCSLSVSHSPFTFPPSSTFFLHTFSFYLYLSFPLSLVLFFSMPSLPGLLATFWTPPSDFYLPLLRAYVPPPPYSSAFGSLFTADTTIVVVSLSLHATWIDSPGMLQLLTMPESERECCERSRGDSAFRTPTPVRAVVPPLFSAGELFGSVGACACLPVELSLFTILVITSLRLSSFFSSYLSLSVVLSFVHCTMPVWRFLPNSVKCDFFGWSKKSLCDYILPLNSVAFLYQLIIQCDPVRNLRYLYDSVCNLETSELIDINIITQLWIKYYGYEKYSVVNNFIATVLKWDRYVLVYTGLYAQPKMTIFCDRVFFTVSLVTMPTDPWHCWFYQSYIKWSVLFLYLLYLLFKTLIQLLLLIYRNNVVAAGCRSWCRRGSINATSATTAATSRATSRVFSSC